MLSSTYPTLTPAANLYENKAEAKSNHILISVNRIVAKSAIFKSSNLVINGDRTVENLKFGWRNLNKKFYFIKITGMLSSKTINGRIIPYRTSLEE